MTGNRDGVGMLLKETDELTEFATTLVRNFGHCPGGGNREGDPTQAVWPGNISGVDRAAKLQRQRERKPMASWMKHNTTAEEGAAQHETRWQPCVGVATGFECQGSTASFQLMYSPPGFDINPGGVEGETAPSP